MGRLLGLGGGWMTTKASRGGEAVRLQEKGKTTITVATFQKLQLRSM